MFEVNLLVTVVLAAAVSSVVSFLLTRINVIWAVSKFLGRHYQKALVAWHKRQARRIMQNELGKQGGFQIPIPMFNASVAVPVTTQGCAKMEPIVPSNSPKWLNDYYVVSALESLHAAGLAFKAKLPETGSWPPGDVTYLIGPCQSATNGKELAEKADTDSYCRLYQGFEIGSCTVGPRFDAYLHRETIAYDQSRSVIRRPLREESPPCDRCWEHEETEKNLASLVANLIQNELHGELATPALSSIPAEIAPFYQSFARGPFMETAVAACMEQGVDPRSKDAVQAALPVVRRTVEEFRRTAEGIPDVPKL